jgi:hypothetical protein
MPDSTHDYECPEPNCEFISAGWGTKKARDERGRQHKAEHETREPMQELADFERSNG